MRRFGGVLVLVLLFTLRIACFGQGGATGTITGTVSDSTGALVSKATVTIRNTGTGVSQKVLTTESGDYTLPNLIPGEYSVSAEAPGFSKAQVNNITLAVAQQARVGLTLKPGESSQTVEVDAAGVALDTDSSSVSQLVGERQVQQLPLNGRNFLNLLFIGAGAVQTVGEQGQMRQGEGNAISISGARPESNNYTLDGLSNTDTALNTPAVILSQDAIQEFKVQSGTYSAEYGVSANQVNIVSKSGGNQLHGSVFEFFRNDALDASTHFQATKPELRQNQFGFVVSGPVMVPKLYDGRNRTFWLANYEGSRIRNGVTGYYNVPTAAELAGNFAASGLPAYGTAACTSNLSLGMGCMPIDPQTGTAFASNTISNGRFSRLANVMAPLIPTPNCLTSGCLGNYSLATALPSSTDQQTYRIDQSLNRFGTVFFRYTRANYDENLLGTPSVPIGNSTFNEISTSIAAAHTITLPHNIVNNFRFGYLHAQAIQGAAAAPASAVSALNINGVFPNLPDYARGYPNVTLAFLGGVGTGAAGSAITGSPGNVPTTSDIPLWEYADTVTLVRGRHTLSTGFDFRSWVQKRDLSTNFLGSYLYANTTILNNSTNCTTATCGTGNAVADFLLGYYSNAATYQPGPFSNTSAAPGNQNDYVFKYLAPFIQDDWKASEKLTINLGLRWDYRSVPYEQSNKMFWIDTQNTNGGLCFANPALLTDGIAPVGNGFYRYCGRHNPKDGSKLPFSPRFGFAYRVGNDGKTVVRGGYSLVFDSEETREIDNSGDLYPYVIRTSLYPTSNSSAPKLTDNLFPTQSALQAVTVANQGSQFVAVIISENPRNPYVQQWTLSVERELARNTTLEINYVGDKGTHLLNRTNINQPYPLTDPRYPAGTLQYCQTNPTDAAHFCTLQSRVPLQNFTDGGYTLDSHWSSYSSYNAGNIKLERRATDLSLVAVYTYSRSMDDKSAAAGIGATNSYAGHMNDHNPNLDYARSDFDVGQRFVFSSVYDLPIGRGKHFLGGVNRATDLLVGGWEGTVIATFQQGFPFSILASDLNSLLAAPVQRANQIGNPNSGFNKSVNQWFNTAAFSQPLAGAFGTSSRNLLRQPGINNFDMGAIKFFHLTDRLNFQFRVEAFNVFNHVQYGVDPTSASAAASGPGTGAVDRQVGDATFGQVTSARPGRILQLGAKLTF